MNTGIIVLAAGRSARFGQPKQLLEFDGDNLLNHAVQTAVGIAGDATILVLGSNIDLIRAGLKPSQALIADNPYWPDGIASSVRTGLNKLIDLQPQAEAVIFMVCDQPYIHSEVLESLIAAAARSDKGIVASEYKQLKGTPALFKKKYFPELLELQGDEGAKKLFHQYAADVETVPFELGYIDIDTAEDYRQLKSR